MTKEQISTEAGMEIVVLDGDGIEHRHAGITRIEAEPSPRDNPNHTRLWLYSGNDIRGTYVPNSGDVLKVRAA